jgi:uncharacterized protein (TIGR02646 family)
MILIHKNVEPDDWRRQRKTSGSVFDGTEKTLLRASLLDEQGYLCAYCMRRIRLAKEVKIEHYHARNAANQLDYENLLAVCTGNATLRGEWDKVDPKRFTCDSMKKNQELHIDPQSQSDMETIYYDLQGKIYSDSYQYDLDQVLNLNDRDGYLISNRKAALQPLIHKLSHLRPGQDAMPLLNKLRKYCYEKNVSGEYPEYAGIMRWFVDRQIRKHQ